MGTDGYAYKATVVHKHVLGVDVRGVGYQGGTIHSVSNVRDAPVTAPL